MLESRSSAAHVNGVPLNVQLTPEVDAKLCPAPGAPGYRAVYSRKARIAAWIQNGDRPDAAARAERGDRQGGHRRKRAAGHRQRIADRVTGAADGDSIVDLN